MNDMIEIIAAQLVPEIVNEIQIFCAKGLADMPWPTCFLAEAPDGVLALFFSCLVTDETYFSAAGASPRTRINDNRILLSFENTFFV